jgi:hypothetical protein
LRLAGAVIQKAHHSLMIFLLKDPQAGSVSQWIAWTIRFAGHALASRNRPANNHRVEATWTWLFQAVEMNW